MANPFCTLKQAEAGVKSVTFTARCGKDQWKHQSPDPLLAGTLQTNKRNDGQNFTGLIGTSMHSLPSVNYTATRRRTSTILHEEARFPVSHPVQCRCRHGQKRNNRINAGTHPLPPINQFYCHRHNFYNLEQIRTRIATCNQTTITGRLQRARK